jgi:hypothetical protein
MAEAIADAGDRKAAGFDIQMLEDIVDALSSEPVSEVMQAVNAAYRWLFGTTARRRSGSSGFSGDRRARTARAGGRSG